MNDAFEEWRAGVALALQRRETLSERDLARVVRMVRQYNSSVKKPAGRPKGSKTKQEVKRYEPSEAFFFMSDLVEKQGVSFSRAQKLAGLKFNKSEATMRGVWRSFHRWETEDQIHTFNQQHDALLNRLLSDENTQAQIDTAIG